MAPEALSSSCYLSVVVLMLSVGLGHYVLKIRSTGSRFSDFVSWLLDAGLSLFLTPAPSTELV